uniref:Uncharacterized protein n=1 Tax=Mimivirus LCMiAC01 TaxID=2506608 RepID=A0A481Z017_9VIRU|nr:MAG: hypothetical protein LCMiAC01_05340 [Mimivirus LCMiAC01]
MSEKSQMTRMIGPITSNIINTCIREIKKKENIQKINNNIINPVMSKVLKKCYPYGITFLIIQIIIITLLVYLVINIKKKQ